MAMVNRAKFVGGGFSEAGTPILEMELNAVAILPGIAADDVDCSFENEARKALERFAQNRFFLLQLKLVGGVLILTTAAGAEINTGRSDTLRGGRENFDVPAAQQAGFDLIRRRADPFGRQDEWRKNDLAIAARQSLAPINPLFNIEVHSGGRFL
jgi:hypothetical protein